MPAVILLNNVSLFILSNNWYPFIVSQYLVFPIVKILPFTVSLNPKLFVVASINPASYKRKRWCRNFFLKDDFQN